MAKVTLSPLRYPGGKNILYDYVKEIILTNDLHMCTYVEPYTGGGSVAIKLLKENIVDSIIINDFDRSIYSFWYCVLYKTEELCKLIIDTEINIDNWKLMKEIQLNKENADLLDLGFSTLFLNRTNISGIIKAGVIGGKNQNGNYKMDCRFNKDKIINKITDISKYKDKIFLYNLDTLDLINKVVKKINKRLFIFFDPPYYNKGSSLYVNFYDYKDHMNLRDAIDNLNNIPWIVTYDNVPEICELYKSYRQKDYSLMYTANKPKKGKEVMIYSSIIKIPHLNI